MLKLQRKGSISGIKAADQTCTREWQKNYTMKHECYREQDEDYTNKLS